MLILDLMQRTINEEWNGVKKGGFLLLASFNVRSKWILQLSHWTGKMKPIKCTPSNWLIIDATTRWYARSDFNQELRYTHFCTIYFVRSVCMRTTILLSSPKLTNTFTNFNSKYSSFIMQTKELRSIQILPT